MRTTALVLMLGVGSVVLAAEVESRVLTHYVPQDTLEAAVRKEGWTEIPLKVKGGVRKGDVVRVWAGGSIDRGGDVPGQNTAGPEGIAADVPGSKLALSPDSGNAHALLFRTEGAGVQKARPAGKPPKRRAARRPSRSRSKAPAKVTTMPVPT